MKIVDRHDIANWANRQESKGNFPLLMNRLIYMTAPRNAQITVPSGSATYLPGWDGIVISEEASEPVPAGTSLWEFGTDLDFKGKAEKEYIKRTADPLGFDPSICTFVFVTPRLWTQKDEWIAEKMTENKWMDIRVYDSVSLEDWLMDTRPVATWFATFVGKLPFDGSIAADTFWEEWSVDAMGILPPKTVTSGREAEIEKILKFLNADPGLMAIKAPTKDEAIAFIIGAVHGFEAVDKDRFFSKTLLVENEASYRAIRMNSRLPLNLIPRFGNTTALYAAVSNKHHVIVPLGGDDTINQEVITLPAIRKEGQVEGLMEMGFSRTDAEKYSKEAGRNITILRRLLGFSQSTAAWYKEFNLREIIPALLLGRWNGGVAGDRAIMEKLSGMPYADYEIVLTKWRDTAEAPILQIGDTWRLTSPFDFWSKLSGILTEKDFNLLAECFNIVYTDENMESSNDSQIVSYFSKPKKYSSWSKEGLTQSMILIAKFGDDLKISNIHAPQAWVDNQVYDLLKDADGKLWISISQQLPLISEASPNSFFNAVHASLKKENPPIMEMFAEKPGILGGSSSHPGLLWALEGLAWLPEYLYDASFILLKLARLDPGGNLVNRPKNSLREIYMAWHHQTLAGFEDRMEILKQITSVEPVSGWDLLVSLLPQNFGHASPTHRMRWRLFDKNTNIKHTVQESYRTYNYVIELLLSRFDGTSEKFTELITSSAHVQNLEQNEKFLSFFEDNYALLSGDANQARDAIRKILSHHRAYPDTDWSLPEENLARYEIIYHKLEPSDVIAKYKWLFDNWHVELIDGGDEIDDNAERFKKRIEKVDRMRIEALNAIIESYGFLRVLSLNDEVKDPGTIGQTLSKMPLTEDQIIETFQLIKSEKSSLVEQFVRYKSFSDGVVWLFKLYDVLIAKGFSFQQLGQIFTQVQQSQDVWDFLKNASEEVESEYWKTVNPTFYHVTVEEKIYGIEQLLKHKRFFSAIGTSYMMKDDIPSELIVRVLNKAGTEKAEEDMHLREYEVSALFEKLNKDETISEDDIAQLEWSFLPIIGSYGTSYNPKKLHKKLATDPAFFVEVLRWVYVPKDESLREEEQKHITEEQQANFAHQGYRLLSEWKTIPGVNDNGQIDKTLLNTWVDEVRELAKGISRLEVADAQIGQMLAQYSEANKEYWPPDEISELIERIGTESLINNFSASTSNKRGFTSRGPFDGGAIERNNAEHFQKLSDTHQAKHPIVSKVFADMAANYRLRAKEEDEQAERDRLEY